MSRNPLVKALQRPDKADRQVFRVGIVTKTIVSGGSVEVSIGGATGLSAAYLAHYTPNIGDTVSILQTDSDLCIFGLIHTGS